MSHGGRIGRWEGRVCPIPTTLIIVGYQAPGTPDGAWWRALRACVSAG